MALDDICDWFATTPNLPSFVRKYIDRAFLQSAGAWINVRDRLERHYVMTPLGYACMQNNPSIAELLCDIGRGGDINEPDTRYGDTPLHHVCREGAMEACEWLISKGANVTVTNSIEATPLIAACMHGHKDVGALVLAASMPPPRLYIPFFVAFRCFNRNKATAVCTWLIQIGAVDHTWNMREILTCFNPQSRELQDRKAVLLSWARTSLQDAAAFRLARRGLSVVPESVHGTIASFIGEDVENSDSLEHIRAFLQVILQTFKVTGAKARQNHRTHKNMFTDIK